MNAQVRDDRALLDRLVGLVGREHVLLDAAERRFYSTDVYAQRELPLAVVRPGSTDEVAAVVAAACAAGVSVVPRGGGASYTDGYLPNDPSSILLDTARLDRIVDLNAQDMYVTVEAGVTWAKLNEALAGLGLRTPFYGPFSGLAATVGGSISQHSVSWGTGVFGVSAESVLALEVVLADGRIVRTGTAGTLGASPFFRHYGPDLTGLFTGDAGALGVKTRITLRLMRRPSEYVGLSFRFADFDSMYAGMVDAAREGLNSINFGLDPRLQQGQIGKTTVSDGLKAAGAVFRSSRSLVDGASRVIRMGLAGRRFLGADFSVHYVVEGVDRTAARAAAGALRDLLGRHGQETAATVPNVVQSMPFAPLYNVLGPRGERWVPIHTVLPFSKVLPFRRDLEKLYGEHAERMRAARVDYGAMFMTVSTNAFLYEPVFYWEDARNACHERLVPADYLATLPEYPANPAGAALVAEMKRAIIDLMHRHGGAHLQIGKVYPYLADREAEAEKLLRDLKRSVDPQGRLNPGALGL
jgi:FAD/FMN-containing dehydrogenase